jgi:hypothetical protein
MNARCIVFRTNRFNLSKAGEHFINPCCFGEDLAAWLREKLIEKDVETNGPYQEDWGWEFRAALGSDSYYLGVGGNSDQLPEDRDMGEWRIIVEKRRSLGQRLRGAGRIAEDDRMLRTIEAILGEEPTIEGVRREE